MAEETKGKLQIEKPKPELTPLVFISHDARDAEFAEAFSKLLGSVSAGMLKSFRSSDKKGTEGIEFGDEWYKRLMAKLQSASDVVCLLTKRSFKRPWILYEAGVAKGKLNKPVLGIAIGIPLKKVSTGPFYQFQNCDDSEGSLKKLILQLANRIPGLAPDSEVVQTQVKTFKIKVDEILSKLGKTSEEEETTSESSTARVLEEFKTIVRQLPKRVEHRLLRMEKRLSNPDLREQQRRKFHIHPKFIREFIRPDNPIGILLATSMFRDEAPWFEVLGREVYVSMMGKNRIRTDKAVRALQLAMEFMFYTPFGKDLFGESEEDSTFLRDAMENLENMLALIVRKE